MATHAFNLQKPTAAHDAKPELLDNEQDSHGRLDALVLSNFKSGMKLGILLALLLQYAESLVAYICGLSVISVEEPSDNKMKVGGSELASLLLRGANVEAGTQVAAYSQLTLYLTTTLL
jgi:hypothetical protein